MCPFQNRKCITLLKFGWLLLIRKAAAEYQGGVTNKLNDVVVFAGYLQVKYIYKLKNLSSMKRAN